MSNPAKALFSMFILLIVLTYTVFNSDINLINIKQENYSDAIQTASQVATLNIMDASDINKTYDGEHRDTQDIAINFDALDDFRSTLYRLLDSKKGGELAGVSNINIPLVGFVTYDYIVGVTYGEAYIDSNTLSSLGYTYDEYIKLDAKTKSEVDELLGNLRGAYLLPMGYTYYYDGAGESIKQHDSDDSDDLNNINNKIWKFTLGDSIYIPDEVYSGVYDGSGEVQLKESRYIIDDTGKLLCKATKEGLPNKNLYYDMSEWLESIGFNTLFEFRDYIVTSSINEYLNGYSGALFNETASNTGTAIDFQLSLAGYSDSFENYTGKSSIIQGPGMFAIIDVYTGTGDNYKLYERIASFGGSELVYNAELNKDN